MTILQTASKAFSDHVYGVDHVLFFQFDLRTPPKIKKMTSKTGTVRIGSTLREIAPLAAAFPDRMKHFGPDLDQGALVFFFVTDEDVAGYVWAATKDIYDEAFFRRTFHVKPGDFFQFNGYVRPERRGSPVALITMHSMHDHFFEQGSIHARTTISSRNPTSFRFHLKMGTSRPTRRSMCASSSAAAGRGKPNPG